jgi:DNA-binding transcriptional LysR family regulator
VARKPGENFHIFVASPTYASACRGSGMLQDRERHGDIMLSTPTGKTIWCTLGPACLKEVEVIGRFRVNTVRAMTRAARAGSGVASLRAMFVAAEIRGGTLVNLLPRHRREAGGMHIVFATFGSFYQQYSLSPTSWHGRSKPCHAAPRTRQAGYLYQAQY